MSLANFNWTSGCNRSGYFSKCILSRGLTVFNFVKVKIAYLSLRIEILSMDTGIRGYRTRMGRVWAHFYTHGYYPYPTRQVMGRAWVQLYTHGYTHILPVYTDMWTLLS